MNLCHIEVVTSEMDVPLSELEMSRVLEPDNPKDCFQCCISTMGYVTKFFRSLAKEEHDRGSHLVALNQWSRSIWRCALTLVH